MRCELWVQSAGLICQFVKFVDISLNWIYFYSQVLLHGYALTALSEPFPLSNKEIDKYILLVCRFCSSSFCSGVSIVSTKTSLGLGYCVVFELRLLWFRVYLSEIDLWYNCSNSLYNFPFIMLYLRAFLRIYIWMYVYQIQIPRHGYDLIENVLIKTTIIDLRAFHVCQIWVLGHG